MVEMNDCFSSPPKYNSLKNNMNKYIVVMASSLVSLYMYWKVSFDSIEYQGNFFKKKGK
jgi:hypothetical protein